MRLYDRLSIDGTNKTATGYLTVSAKVAKAGNVQMYLGTEVGKPEMAQVRVYRPRDEVMNARPSFAHRPVTLGHPSKAVTADNWKDVARGWTGDEVAIDGDIIRVPMLLADAEAIRAVEGGTRQLSMGYDCTLDWTPGTSPTGEAYDAVQRGIRGNHVAIVDAARGGPELTFGDQAMTPTIDTMPAASMTLDDALKLPRYQGMSPGNARQFATRDLAMMQIGSRSADYEQGVRDHHNEQLSEAWKPAAPVNDNKPADPHFAKDGRPFAQLSPGDQARERMIQNLSDGYKA
jgi:hypothetical protein